jgi:Arylsulfotransferase (ASST)
MDEARWTRSQLLRRGAAAGIALAAPRLVFDDAFAAAAAPASASVHSYVSRPDLTPPVVQILKRDPGATADGLIFMAPLSGPGARGNMLLNDDGSVVYFHPTKPVVSLNFRAAVYQGKPVLTWWEGKTEHGLGEGSHVVLDETYRVVKRLPAGNGHASDLHEFLLTDRNTALVTAWEPVEADLRRYGGKKNGVVINGIVQELDIATRRVLFEWKSMDHIALTESHAKVGPTFDYFHVNSVQRLSDGDYLVSARNTWGIYKIDGQTGRVVWRLGGKKSDFAMGPGTGFAWQHDARLHPENLVSLFDDGGAPRVEPQSKGLVLALDVKRMRATQHRRYVHSPPALAHALGSTQLLPNGNVLIGWGTSPYFTEYTDGGTVVLDATLPAGGQNYRTLRFPWVGRPYFPPAARAAAQGDGQVLYVSWNGATEVATWQLETGTDPSKLTEAAKVQRTRFETAIPVPSGTRVARATALDASGAPLGQTEAVTLA